MYDFHYNFIKKHFDAKLLFTDKDSLTYEIKSEDVYEELFNHKHLFDFSNYSKDKILRLSLMSLKTLHLIKKLSDKMKRIQSKNHKIETYEINKIIIVF